MCARACSSRSCRGVWLLKAAVVTPFAREKIKRLTLYKYVYSRALRFRARWAPGRVGGPSSHCVGAPYWQNEWWLYGASDLLHSIPLSTINRLSLGFARIRATERVPRSVSFLPSFLILSSTLSPLPSVSFPFPSFDSKLPASRTTLRELSHPFPTLAFLSSSQQPLSA